MKVIGSKQHMHRPNVEKWLRFGLMNTAIYLWLVGDQAIAILHTVEEWTAPLLMYSWVIYVFLQSIATASRELHVPTIDIITPAPNPTTII